jgi:hypothetical protein
MTTTGQKSAARAKEQDGIRRFRSPRDGARRVVHAPSQPSRERID